MIADTRVVRIGSRFELARRTFLRWAARVGTKKDD